MLSVFGSTNLCEQVFSIMNIDKSFLSWPTWYQITLYWAPRPEWVWHPCPIWRTRLTSSVLTETARWLAGSSSRETSFHIFPHWMSSSRFRIGPTQWGRGGRGHAWELSSNLTPPRSKQGDIGNHLYSLLYELARDGTQSLPVSGRTLYLQIIELALSIPGSSQEEGSSERQLMELSWPSIRLKKCWPVLEREPLS